MEGGQRAVRKVETVEVIKSQASLERHASYIGGLPLDFYSMVAVLFAYPFHAFTIFLVDSNQTKLVCEQNRLGLILI